MAYKFALVGHNISYSKSPEVFDAIFRLAGVDGSFLVFNVGPRSFGLRFRDIIREGVSGLSVTIPFKKRVMAYLDEVDPIAQALEAVNSVRVSSSRLSGYNTDCYGFALPLFPFAEKLKHGRALVLGCGGAAKAALYSLYVDFEVRRFTVVGRSHTKLQRFARLFRGRLPQSELETIPYTELPGIEGRGYSIIVNGSPLGGPNHPTEAPLPVGFSWGLAAIYYDVNYNDNNEPVARARDRGLLALDGSAMLVGQAIRSFQLWTGMKVEMEPVHRAVFSDRALPCQ